MDDYLNHDISCLIDDELKMTEALALLKKIQLNPDLSQLLNRYQIARYALSSKHYVPIEPNFLKGIQEKIQNEPSYFLPSHQKPSPKLLALAACVALVTLIAFGMLYQQSPKMNRMSAPNIIAKQTPTTIKHKTRIPAPVQTARLNNYIQAHNNSLYTSGIVTPSIQTAHYQTK